MSIPNSQFISPPPHISWRPQVYFLYLKLYFCFVDKFICTLYKKRFHISVQSLSHVWLFATPWTVAHQASLSITNSWSLLKLMSLKSVMPSNHLILCHPLLLLPSISPSIRVFSNKSVLFLKWPKYWSFNFNISPSDEYSGLISFRMDWLDLLAVQGTLKSSPTHGSFSMDQIFSYHLLSLWPWTGCFTSPYLSFFCKRVMPKMPIS